MNLVLGQGVWGIGGHAISLPNVFLQRSQFEFQDFLLCFAGSECQNSLRSISIIFVLQMGAYSFEDDTP